MVKAILLNGFMAHEALTIEPAPGLTLISGPNRKGKSCIFRALDWLLYGGGPRWSDDESKMELLHRGSDSSEVVLEFTDRPPLARRRDVNGQELEITLAGEHKILTSGVREWPDLVTRATGFRRVELAAGVKDPLNLSMQHDPPFLLSWPPEKADQAIGRMAGADTLEWAVAEARKLQRRAGTERDRAAEDLERLESMLASYDPLTAAGELLASATTVEERRTRRAAETLSVSSALERVSRLWLVPPENSASALAAVAEADERIRALVSSRSGRELVERPLSRLSEIHLVAAPDLDTAGGMLQEAGSKSSSLGATRLRRTQVRHIVLALERLRFVPGAYLESVAAGLSASQNRLRAIAGAGQQQRQVARVLERRRRDVGRAAELSATCALLTELLERLESVVQHVVARRALVSRVRLAHARLMLLAESDTACRTAGHEAAADLATGQRAHHDRLLELGTCPTCGADIR